MQISSLAKPGLAPNLQASPKTTAASSGDRFDFNKDCLDQAGWLAQECKARFNCTPNELMKGPEGFERFSQLAAEWREAHPRD
ncbi:hypothetical protein JST97_04230 [bacterium]|nr:hypothetical protein [bacterium]